MICGGADVGYKNIIYFDYTICKVNCFLNEIYKSAKMSDDSRIKLLSFTGSTEVNLIFNSKINL